MALRANALQAGGVGSSGAAGGGGDDGGDRLLAEDDAAEFAGLPGYAHFDTLCTGLGTTPAVMRAVAPLHRPARPRV